MLEATLLDFALKKRIATASLIATCAFAGLSGCQKSSVPETRGTVAGESAAAKATESTADDGAAETTYVATEDVFAPGTYTIAAGEQSRFELQERLIQSVPGDVIQLEEGVYKVDGQLDVICDHLTIRGAGIDKTILSFENQVAGSEGLVATGDAFTIEDLAIEDTVGNAIKVLGADGVVFRRVRTEWTNGPDPDNGAYGIYPVQCSNVLIEDCVAIGASDAGVYVGQSRDVVVRGCRAEFNVAGIEIENTLGADVYDNVATNNTGGLLVFDLPGLQLTNGGHVRIRNNRVFNNNIDNFAPPGNMVGTVPPGTGLMILVTDNVEVFDNVIENNKTVGVSVVSYMTTGRPAKDPKFDPIPEGISIHDNKIVNNGAEPSGELGQQLAGVVGVPFAQIFFDGIINPARLVDGKLPDELALKISNNGDATFANANLATLSPENVANGTHTVDRDVANYAGTHEPIAKVSLAEFPPPSANGNPAVAIYRQAPPQISGWNFFEGDPAEHNLVEGVIPYELNTPLFSDYTSKYRFIRLPEGESMTFAAEKTFQFPVGTVIGKTFTMPHDMRDLSKGERLLETRIEERHEDGWYGYTYVWNEDENEANLALGGSSIDLTWINADGEEATNLYQIPNANQCISCHGQDEKFSPLGPTAANMNRSYAHSEQNQLAHWAEEGWLKESPDVASIAPLPRFDDPETGDVHQRARAWLEVNCAHCHNPVGSARTSGLDLSIRQETPAKFGVWKSPVATGRGSGGRKFDIVPGKPEESILLYRLESDEAGVRMPSLARNLVHDEAVALIREWVSDMPHEAPTGGGVTAK